MNDHLLRIRNGEEVNDVINDTPEEQIERVGLRIIERNRDRRISEAWRLSEVKIGKGKRK